MTFDEQVERATMMLLGQNEDHSPGVNWYASRHWRVNDVRRQMYRVLEEIANQGGLAKPHEPDYDANVFDLFLQEFAATNLWDEMEQTTEKSEWHREPNVANHTMRMLAWYNKKLAHMRTDRERLMTQVCIVFHDVGKPKARAWSEAKGRYHFAGHEAKSAQIFHTVMENRQDWVRLLKFTPLDLDIMELMIEHHVPFEYKRKNLVNNIKASMIARSAHRAWIDLIMSDQHGRVSDQHQRNLDNVMEWFRWWDTVVEPKTDPVHLEYPLLVNYNDSKVD